LDQRKSDPTIISWPKGQIHTYKTLTLIFFPSFFSVYIASTTPQLHNSAATPSSPKLLYRTSTMKGICKIHSIFFSVFPITIVLYIIKKFLLLRFVNSLAFFWGWILKKKLCFFCIDLCCLNIDISFMTFVYSYFLDLSFFNLFFRVFFQIYLYIYVLTFFCFAFVEVVLMVEKIKQISMKHAQARSNVRIFYAFFYLNICIFAKVIY
jgi:hypothetical protein